MTRRASLNPRAFTLIEAIVTIVVMSVAVPPALSMLSDAAAARRDAVSASRATWLATAVLEHVLADVQSAEPGFGFDALADSAVYLSDPATGLIVRLKNIAALYEQFGVTYTVQIGGLVDRSGAVTGDADRDVYRYVSITASWQSTLGGSADLSVGAMVTDL